MLGLRYELTNTTVNNLVEIARLMEKVGASRAPPAVVRRIERDSLTRNAHYSTRIEGNTLTLGQVKSLVDGRAVMAERRAVSEVENYLRVLEGLSSYSLDMEGVLGMHRDITRGVIDNPQASGMLRDVQNYVASATGVVYTPPPPEEVAPMMEELVAWAASQEAAALNPVVHAALVHYAVAMVHPFEDGNGRLARALAMLVLRKRGFDPRGLLALDEYYEGDRQNYYAALRRADEAGGDLTSWLEYYTDGILYSATTVQEVMGSFERAEGLAPRQRKALKHVVKHGFITNRGYREMNGVSNKTAYQDLKEMVEKGVLTEEGAGRSKRYVIPEL